MSSKSTVRHVDTCLAATLDRSSLYGVAVYRLNGQWVLPQVLGEPGLCGASQIHD